MRYAESTTTSRRYRDLPWPELSLATYELQSAVQDTLIVRVYRVAFSVAFYQTLTQPIILMNAQALYQG